ncbi:ArsR family transcriptional regulator [Nitratireductor sp. L1-7-SE]|uniref:Transcriptional regulator, ArsR family n=2 Tax=Nitratireductor TaxID=245876 RepID=A0A1H4J4W9_9HYPH|nr:MULTISPECIES: helix-turn-helix transcriptional regulator [Nitratireductor]MBY8917397.1 ArsR family transcriptional regulator [Nitratireductor rhodophyticola]MBY8922108.1 ArsR family transcriptional regulator [Nitratireductor rhodophyticola]SEB41399.1 transcriptional regulator, ArsR family [Nitratireductor aquibiodomus]
MLQHPTVDQISLPHVLAVLGDQTRLAILGDLARRGDEPLACAEFKLLGSKSNLSYHFAKLREAGVIRVEPCGTKRLISLRRDDLNARFPGLLDSILATAITLPPPEKRIEQAV